MSGGNLDGALSPFLRRRRIAVARPYLEGRVLDFGCGTAEICRYVVKDHYVGVDIDEQILRVARSAFPYATFLTPQSFVRYSTAPFDTIAALAVIEHLPEPHAFLREMRSRLAPTGRIVLTTPNPHLDWIHGLGSRMGIFAKESHDEHQSLMNRAGLERAARAAGLKLSIYRRFLAGANQLAVLSRE